jgi:hypothetical protein
MATATVRCSQTFFTSGGWAVAWAVTMKPASQARSSGFVSAGELR